MTTVGTFRALPLHCNVATFLQELSGGYGADNLSFLPEGRVPGLSDAGNLEAQVARFLPMARDFVGRRSISSLIRGVEDLAHRAEAFIERRWAEYDDDERDDHEEFQALLREAHIFLRPTEGRVELPLSAVDVLEQAFIECGNDYNRVYGEVPRDRQDVGIHQAISKEQMEALVSYILLLDPKSVVEVGAGDGGMAVSLAKRLKQFGVDFRAVDNRARDFESASIVETGDGVVAAKSADVIIVSWPERDYGRGRVVLDYELAKLVHKNPNKTLIMIFAEEECGTREFHNHVLGRIHSYERAFDDSVSVEPPITLPLQRVEPVLLNYVMAADGKVYWMNRSRRKMGGCQELSRVLVLRSFEGESLPNPKLLMSTGHVPPENYLTAIPS